MVKRVVYIGGFVHWPCVADEFCKAEVVNVGVAPAYVGEDISILRNHSALPDGLPFFSSVSELLHATKPVLAVISTRIDHIAQTAVQVAKTGCDIICEKPMGLSFGEVASVRQAVQRNGVRLLPMLSMRI